MTLRRLPAVAVALVGLACAPDAEQLRRHCLAVCARAMSVCNAVQLGGCDAACTFPDSALRCASLIDAAWSCQDRLSDADFCATSPACETQEAAAYSCVMPADGGSDGGRH